jgi:hypothetical protein
VKQIIYNYFVSIVTKLKAKMKLMLLSLAGKRKKMTYNNFNETTNLDLQTWNRCAMFFNIAGDHGRDEAKKYSAQFNDADKQRMRDLFVEIREKGYEKTRARINRDNQNVH